MKFSAAAVAVLATGASAHYAANVTYVTDVVTAYTTYCPSATTVVHGTKTYTVTEATTLTITDCPCTITKPALPTSAAPLPGTTKPVVTTPPAPVGTGTAPKYTPPASAPYNNGTVPSPPAPPAGTAPGATQPAATTSARAVPTGAAPKFGASAAGLAGALGLAAYFL